MVISYVRVLYVYYFLPFFVLSIFCMYIISLDAAAAEIGRNPVSKYKY